MSLARPSRRRIIRRCLCTRSGWPAGIPAVSARAPPRNGKHGGANAMPVTAPSRHRDGSETGLEDRSLKPARSGIDRFTPVLLRNPTPLERRPNHGWVLIEDRTHRTKAVCPGGRPRRLPA
jgi:hypothetical protein